jgi:hypothetical protein
MERGYLEPNELQGASAVEAGGGWYDELVRIYAQADDGSLLEFSLYSPIR